MMRRRVLLRAGASAAFTGAAVAVSGCATGHKRGPGSHGGLTEAIAQLPNFCTHEHWGSVEALGGWSNGGYRADLEPGAGALRRVNICDLVLDPYFAGWLASDGLDSKAILHALGKQTFAEGWRDNPVALFAALKPHLERNRLNGGFQCTRRGILWLHGIDIASLQLADWQAADRAIGDHYADTFAWYAEVKQRARFTEVLRPVHPEFVVGEFSGRAVEQERALMRPVLRIDPFVDLYRNAPRRLRLAEKVGIEPADADSWRRFLQAIFEAARARGTVATKQLQAYSRTLQFDRHDDSGVDFSGASGRAGERAFGDWIVHECCRLSQAFGWPHQIHTGTANVPDSTPLPLAGLARAYPQLQFVMIHCWPYLREAGWLVKHHPNMHVDTNWQVVLNPSIFAQAMADWLGYIPTAKIMCGHDATSIEMAVGSSRFVREGLAEALGEQQRRLGLPAQQLVAEAADMLQNNAVRLYRLGTLSS